MGFEQTWFAGHDALQSTFVLLCVYCCDVRFVVCVAVVVVVDGASASIILCSFSSLT